MKKTLLAACATFGLVHMSKADVPFRWQQNFEQGNVIASVVVKGGDGFAISCNQGGFGYKPGDASANLFLSYNLGANNYKNPNDPASAIKGADTLQFVIDGKTYELPGNGLQLAPGALDAYGNFNTFMLIQAALTNSKSEYFQFQIPEANFSVNISTVGAGQAIAPTITCK
jgi:hypothetical protein